MKLIFSWVSVNTVLSEILLIRNMLQIYIWMLSIWRVFAFYYGVFDVYLHIQIICSYASNLIFDIWWYKMHFARLQPWNWRCGFNVVKCSDKFSLTHEWILMSFLIVLWRFLCAHRIILELCMGLYKTEI